METPPAPATEIMRHNFGVRIIHWLIALSFILAVVTGPGFPRRRHLSQLE